MVRPSVVSLKRRSPWREDTPLRRRPNRVGLSERSIYLAGIDIFRDHPPSGGVVLVQRMTTTPQGAARFQQRLAAADCRNGRWAAGARTVEFEQGGGAWIRAVAINGGNR